MNCEAILSGNIFSRSLEIGSNQILILLLQLRNLSVDENFLSTSRPKLNCRLSRGTGEEIRGIFNLILRRERCGVNFISLLSIQSQK